LKKKGRDLPARYIWFKKLACKVCGFKAGKTSSISTKYSRSHLEAKKSVMIYASNSFACSRRTSDYGSERALNLEASSGKSDEMSKIDSVEGGGLNRAIGTFLVESYDFTFFAGFW
jgi:hypothetical protein